MDVVQVLHMNAGVGETSYAKNSQVQKKIISKGKSITEEAILDFYCTDLPNCLSIADLGCSTGPNALSMVSEIMNVVYRRCCQLGHPSPEFQVFLNDLPGNDFNSIFKSLPEFYHNLKEDKGSRFGPCFIAGMPGSFYGRLFPSRSLHFVHSSSSLHWLSQVPTGLECKAATPLNKGKIYISKTSPTCVLNAYSTQFQKDFSVFLKSRSQEIVAGGRMVLSFMGRRTTDPTTEESCLHWELLAQALRDLVIKGLVEEDKLDSFNAPYYAPCPEELNTEIQREGSFAIDRLEMFEIDWDGGHYSNELINEENYRAFDNRMSGQQVTKTIRAVVESMFANHFGGEIMDDLFQRFGEIVSDSLSRKRTKYINLVISVIRKSLITI